MSGARGATDIGQVHQATGPALMSGRRDDVKDIVVGVWHCRQSLAPIRRQVRTQPVELAGARRTWLRLFAVLCLYLRAAS